VRREKDWHEKADNERKLWKAGLLAAGVAGLAGGAAVARRFPMKATKAVPQVPPQMVRGPWKKSGREWPLTLAGLALHRGSLRLESGEVLLS
jgi:uncharacterized protein YneF (UPF0154 family)